MGFWDTVGRVAGGRGVAAGAGVVTEAFEWARRRYYELMKWSPDTGVPSEACLRELDLDGFVKDTPKFS